MFGAIGIDPFRSELSGISLNSGIPSRARFSFPEEPRYLNLSIRSTRSAGSSFSSTSLRKVTLGSAPDTTVFA